MGQGRVKLVILASRAVWWNDNLFLNPHLTFLSDFYLMRACGDRLDCEYLARGNRALRDGVEEQFPSQVDGDLQRSVLLDQSSGALAQG